MSECLTVYVVDDDDAVRHSLAFLFDAAGLEVKTFESSVAFLAQAPSLPRGCVLTDVRMPEMDGLELQKKLKEAGVTLPVIVMTGHGDIPIAVQALKSGALDFIEKPFDDEVLLAAVRGALKAAQLSHDQDAQTAGISERMSALTPREREVLEGLIAGHPNKTIAFDLGMSPRTVEVHRARVMEKMQARSLSELVRMVLVTGMPLTTASHRRGSHQPES